MGFPQAEPGSADDEDHDHGFHMPTLFDHVHRHAFHAAPPARAQQLKREEGPFTALDVIVVAGGSTVGDVLLGSIPSEPTTVSLPGFGPLTLSSFVPAQTTPSANIAASPASSASLGSSTSSLVSVTSSGVASFTGFPTASVSLNSSASSMTMFNTLSSSLTNNTASFSNFTTTAFNMTTTSSSSFTTFSSSTVSRSSSSASSSQVAASPGPVGGGVPQSPPTSAPTSTPVAASSDNHAGPIAGGVVGGVAGALLLAALIFLFARRLRQGSNGTRLDDGEDGTSAPVSRDGPTSANMTQRSSLVPFAAAGAMGRWLPSNRASTQPSDQPTERGFQRVSGRKLMPVIASGGDGYSEPPMPSHVVARNLSTDFTTDSLISDAAAASTAAAAGRRTAASPTSNRGGGGGGGGMMPADRAAALRSERMFSSSPDSEDGRAAAANTPDLLGTPSPPEEMVVQPGPQRTPVVARRPGDGLGRSRPSQDGSRVSRFSETF